MNVSQSFKLALKSLRTSKMRAFLTMLGIVIGVAAVIIIISLGNGLTGMVEQQVQKLGVTQVMFYTWGRGDGSTMELDSQSVMDFIDSHPEAFSGVTPWVNGGQGVRQGSSEFKKTGIYGVSEAMYRSENGTTLDGEPLAKGRYLQYVDVAQRKNVCVIGAYLEQEAFRGDALGNTLYIGGVPYTVIGVMQRQQTTMTEGSSDDRVYIPYENAMALSGSRTVTLYQATAVSRDTVGQAKALLNDMLWNFYQDEDAYYIETMLDQVNLINAMMGVAMAVLIAIAAISLLVGGIGIMNIMLVSVTERTREIGIRKALGAKEGAIMRQFVIEAATTSALGGVLGILAGFGLSSVATVVIAKALETSLTVRPSVGAVLLAFGVSTGIGVVFGYLPAKKAARLNPIEALRFD